MQIQTFKAAIQNRHRGTALLTFFYLNSFIDCLLLLHM